MTGASPGDAEDLLGQFLAHRAAPTPRRAANQPALEADAVDEALEESVDGPVYELADAPLDFPDSEPEAEFEPEPESEPEPPVAETMAHAGAVLEAFAAGTLDIAPDAAPDDPDDPDALDDLDDPDDSAHEVDRGAEDLEVDPVPPPAAAAPSPSPSNDASRAVLAAFLGAKEPEPALPTEAEQEPPPPARPDEVTAFEDLAVSSPLTREPPAARGHRADGPARVADRPDSTAASAAVFAAFQEQLAGQEAQPDPAQDTPDPEPVPEPEPAPEPEPEPEPVRRAEPEPQPEPEWRREPEPQPEPEPEQEQPIAPPVARAPAPKPPSRRAPRTTPKVTAPRLPAAPARASEPTRPAVPNEVVFRPRRMARALVALILLVFVAASAVACWWAYRDRTLVPVGIATTVLIATGIVWATRAGSTVAHMSVRGGRLEITKDGTRTVFDLASQYTDVQVHGSPGKRGWRVMFGRRGLPPYVIDASMVSPAEFMRVLDYYRPSENRPAER